jgi:hypothetical protein
LTPALLTRAAVAPADTSTSGWASQLAGKAVASFIASLAPESAAAKLMQAGTFINMDGVAELTVPWPSTNPQPAFVAEGGAIPVAQGALTGVTLGPPSKLAAIEAFTRELAAHSVDAAEVVIGDLMRAAATQALDGAVFSTTAASTTRPAGILNGVSAIAATGGGGAAAMLADIDALISAIVTAGGGRSIMFFASPGRAVRLRALAGIDLGLPIIPTPTLTGTTLVAVEAGGFASGFGSDPNISSRPRRRCISRAAHRRRSAYRGRRQCQFGRCGSGYDGAPSSARLCVDNARAGARAARRQRYVVNVMMVPPWTPDDEELQEIIRQQDRELARPLPLPVRTAPERQQIDTVAAQQRNAAAWNTWADKRIISLLESFADGAGKVNAKNRREVRAEWSAQIDAAKAEILDTLRAEMRAEIDQAMLSLLDQIRGEIEQVKLGAMSQSPLGLPPIGWSGTA